jgi:hypothetical protein
MRKERKGRLRSDDGGCRTFKEKKEQSRKMTAGQTKWEH